MHVRSKSHSSVRTMAIPVWLLWYFPLVNVSELVQLSIGYMPVNIEFAKFVSIKIFLVVTKGLGHWVTYPISIMENWNQDHPERYSNLYGLYIEFQRCGNWPWTWWGRRKSQGHWPHPTGHGKWWKACINICKHILKFSNCVLVRVPMNNNNYEQPIALFVIILAKNTFKNNHGKI